MCIYVEKDSDIALAWRISAQEGAWTNVHILCIGMQ